MTNENKLNLDRIWHHIGFQPFSHINDNIMVIAEDLLSLLILKLAEEAEFEIGLFISGEIEGSIVSYDIYDASKELSLEMISKGYINIAISLEDDDGDFRTIRHRLTEEQVYGVPELLREMMYQVLITKQPATFNLLALGS